MVAQNSLACATLAHPRGLLVVVVGLRRQSGRRDRSIGPLAGHAHAAYSYFNRPAGGGAFERHKMGKSRSEQVSVRRQSAQVFFWLSLPVYKCQWIWLAG